MKSQSESAPKGAILLVLLVTGLLSSCSGRSGPSVSYPAVALADRPFLIDPLEGLSGRTDSIVGQEIRALHRSLVETGDTDEVRAAIVNLSRERDSPATVVLMAQVDFVAGLYESAYARGRKACEVDEAYTAAQLVAGRSAERLGQLVDAFVAYQTIAPQSPAAAQRTTEIAERVAEILKRRVSEALGRGQAGAATSELERLEEWFPNETATIEAVRAVATAIGDEPRELSALRRLAPTSESSFDLVVRRAELEIAIGDPSQGLRLLRDLELNHPGDPRLSEPLAKAEFSWRLELLPQEVQDSVARPTLSRGQFATLLFWLFPDIRYGTSESRQIANDVLDHPQRQEIVRVLNSGVMEVDRSLHRFFPEEPIQRVDALSSLLAVLKRGQSVPSCLPEAATGLPQAWQEVCATAARCGILTKQEECLPTAGLSGREALEWIRRSQDLQPATEG